MQNAGLQYGQGATHVQESPFATSLQNGSSSSTTTLRQFRKKDNVDKNPGGGLSGSNAGTDSSNTSHVARVAPHNHYPHKQNDYFRYPSLYEDFSAPYKEHTVKYSEIAEPVPQSIPHLDNIPPTVLSKHKEKEYVEMCNIPQQTHFNKHYPEHQFNGQQNFPPEMALHHQYMHKEPQGPQMHSPYKPESQYIPKEGGFNHQISPFLKYNIPQSRNYGPLDNSSLTPFQRMDPHIARSMMSDHPHMREFSSDYGPMEQSRLYAQKQRYYPTPLPPSNSTYPPNYAHRNISSQQYNYPSCNYPRTAQMNPSMGRYPINMERSMSPRRTYSENIDMGMNFPPVPQKMSTTYPNYPAYAQHYQHRRPTAVPQEYFHSQQHQHARQHPPYIPSHHSQEVTENHVASNNIRQYLENWAEEEPTAEIENPKYISRITRDEGNEVYVINASELPQYLENGVPLVTSENGQYIFKSNVSIDNTGAIKIIEKAVENTVLPTDTQERVVSLHIVENPKADCLVNSRQANPNQEHPLGVNQTPTGNVNVITANTNHPNLENTSHQPYTISSTQFNTNRMNLVHQVSPMNQNVTQPPQSFDNSVNLSVNSNIPCTNASPSKDIIRPNPESSLRPSSTLIQSQKTPNTDVINEEITSDKNHLKVLSYNEVPQNSCIVMPSSQNRLNFDESLLPHTVPCNSKETEVRNNTEENAVTNENILNDAHEELDKIVEDTLTSSNIINISLETCDRTQLAKIEEKCNIGEIPDDLNLDLETHPKGISSTEYSIDQNEEIIDLSTSRRGSKNDNIEQTIQSIELDLSVQNNENKQNEVVEDPSKDPPMLTENSCSNNDDLSDEAQEIDSSPKSLIKHMPLIDDQFDAGITTSETQDKIVIESEADSKNVPDTLIDTEDEKNNENTEEDDTTVNNNKKEEEGDITIESSLESTETAEEPIKEKEETMIIPEKQSLHEEPPASEENSNTSLKNDDLDTVLEKKLCEIVGEPIGISENVNAEEKLTDLSKEKQHIDDNVDNNVIPMAVEEMEENSEEGIQPTKIDEDKEGVENLPPKSSLSNEDIVATNELKKEIKKERVARKKRIFSVDDIIYRIGPNSIQNRENRENLQSSSESDIEIQASCQEKKVDELPEVSNGVSSKNESGQVDLEAEKIEESKCDETEESVKKIDAEVPEENMEITSIEENTSTEMETEDIASSSNNLSEIEESEDIDSSKDIDVSSCSFAIESEKGKSVDAHDDEPVPINISEVAESADKDLVYPEEKQETSCNLENKISVDEVVTNNEDVCSPCKIPEDHFENNMSCFEAAENITSVDRTSEFNVLVESKARNTANENEKNCQEIEKNSLCAYGEKEDMVSNDEDIHCEERKINVDHVQINPQNTNEAEMDTIEVREDHNRKLNEEITKSKEQIIDSLSVCRFSVIHKTEVTTKPIAADTKIEESKDAVPKLVAEILEPEEKFEAAEELVKLFDKEEDLETHSDAKEEIVNNIVSNEIIDKDLINSETCISSSVIHSTEDKILEETIINMEDKVLEVDIEDEKEIIEETLVESLKNIKKSSNSSEELTKDDRTFEQRFIEPFLNVEEPSNFAEVEERVSPEDMQYRSILKVEDNNVLLEIGGELVEISVNQVNGKKVITVIPMSSTATVDFNDNYEQVDRAQLCEEIDNEEESPRGQVIPILQEEIFEDKVEKETQNVDESEDITSTIQENGNELFEDIILNENEIIIGDESLEEEINLDLQNNEVVNEENPQPKPMLCTKAAKKLYDDISIPMKTFSSLREFRRIKNQPQSESPKNDDLKAVKLDVREKKSSKHSLRTSSRHRTISEQKEESLSVFQELIKRRKMRKEKIRLKYSQYAKQSKSAETVPSIEEESTNKETERVPKVASHIVKMRKNPVSSVVKKVQIGKDLKTGEAKKIHRDKVKMKDKVRKKSTEEKKEEIDSVNSKEANLKIDKIRLEERPTSTSVIVSLSVTTDPSQKNFHNARNTTTTEISKNVTVQDRQPKFQKTSIPRDLSLTKNVNEHYLSRRDHSNLKKKLSIQEYNSRKRKSDDAKVAVPEKIGKVCLVAGETSKDGVMKNQGKPSTIYSEKLLTCTPNGVKDPRRRPHSVGAGAPVIRTQSEDLNSSQTSDISLSQDFRKGETSQTIPTVIKQDLLLNMKDSYSQDLNYKNYKTLLLEKSSVESFVPKPMKISSRRKTIEVMNERKTDNVETVKKKVSFDDNVQINEINTTQTKVVKMKPESLNYCEVTSSSSDIIDEKSYGDCSEQGEEKKKIFKKVSRLKEKLENSWEDSNSPKDSITDAFADSFLENTKLDLNSKHKNKLIIDLSEYDTSHIENELKSPYRSRLNSNSLSYEDDGSLKNYKDEVDSKLNSLNIQIPKASKTRAFNEDDILMHKFLRKEQLNSEEIKQIRRIIYLKKKIQQLTQQSIATNSESDNYEVKKNVETFSHHDLKLQLKKIDVKMKKKKKRFRNLYSESPETSESEILETAGEFCVYEGKNLSGVKLIFKRKTDLLHLQPVVKLQRCRHIESLAKKLKLE
ncbi:hypothetical protein HHI36_021606 [Cryptolaemus montrouzieri]|uniref:Uncharacterized protein n=1 Tax=Cryptolaemus montrouzieri TaxID=559131 RepID=A0ABD2MX98_9CUCU